MPLFLGVHTFPKGEQNKDTANQKWNEYKQSASSMGLTPVKVLVNYDQGEAYCQTEAETEDQVKQAHNKAQIPFDKIIEVQSFD